MPPSPLDSINPVSTAPPHPALDPSFTVQFWGVRGNIPTPGPQWLTFGGNTACVEVKIGETCLILDGGTGLRQLGQQLLSAGATRAHLFFTHTHWDRIQGFPFFEPAFHPHNHLHIYGGTAINGASIKQCLMAQMVRPNFPIALPRMQAKLHFRDLAPGDQLTLEPVQGEAITVETGSLNRHSRALGYRITWKNHTVVYATDVYPSDQPDPAVLYLARGADLLIYDVAQDPIDLNAYAAVPVATVPADRVRTDLANAAESKDTRAKDTAPTPTAGLLPEPPLAETIWQPGLSIAQAAGVKQLVLFHHHPGYEDEQLLSLEQKLQQLSPQTPCCHLAREGMCLEV